MIHVDRAQVDTPKILLSSQANDARKKAWEVYKKAKLQERMDFDYSVIHHQQVLGTLQSLFHQKCAYCESSIGLTQPVDVEHFRPRLRAINLDGKIDPYHYFWLAYEWTNLLPVCSDCNRSKGSRFPVEGERAAIGAGKDELEKEETLLLNPYDDAPEQHLVFSADGLVTSDTEKGRVSIEIYGLNRPDLVAARRDEYINLMNQLQSLSLFLEVEDTKTLLVLNDPSQPYAGMRRQFIGEWIKKQVAKSSDEKIISYLSKNVRYLPSDFEKIREWIEKQTRKPSDREKVLSIFVEDLANQSPEYSYLTDLETIFQQPVKSKREQHNIILDFKRYSNEQGNYSLQKEEDKNRYYLRSRWIEKIEIHNYKIIKDLTLYPTAGKRGEGPWLMLLGNNATGKSTILQAVALALVGDNYRKKLRVQPEEVLRNRCSSGFVKIHFTGIERPVELHFTRGSTDFRCNLPDPKFLLLGYGATRLLPRGSTKALPGTEFAHVDNLFDPFIPLKDASKWLYDLHDKNEVKFGNVARALKNLLTLEEADELICDPEVPGQVNMRAFGQTVPIMRQSDGYQTVLALTCDIMAILLERWDAMEVAEGIVLIDEIGSHLHPRWQMRVIKSLRRVFPRVQFLVTTHYPLCLRGLYSGEVVVMERTPDDKLIAVDQDLPPIEGMRVDQILTSEYFGLESTYDPDLDDLFNEYYPLLALRNRTENQEKRLQELKSKLDKYRVFGSTRRERLALEAVDEYLSQVPATEDLEKRKNLKEETRQKILKLWAKEREKSEGPG